MNSALNNEEPTHPIISNLINFMITEGMIPRNKLDLGAVTKTYSKAEIENALQQDFENNSFILLLTDMASQASEAAKTILKIRFFIFL
jgi:hypothetical protein